MLSQLEFKVASPVNEDFEQEIHQWFRQAIFFLGAAWYTHKKNIVTIYKVSERLQLRWILTYGVPRVLIEQSKSEDGWLMGYRVGEDDPFTFAGFTRSHEMTKNVISFFENVARIYLPQIEIVQCYYCDNRFGNELLDEKWICSECQSHFTKDKGNRAGFVYIFGSVADGYFKIGCGNVPLSRMKDYENSKLPFPVEMICQIPADDKRQAEAELHRLFREKHTNGEWYRLLEEDLSKVITMKKYVSGRWIAG